MAAAAQQQRRERALIPLIDPGKVISHQIPQEDLSYDERDVALYALGVGAGAANAIDPIDLPYVYHARGQKYIKVLPTFAVLFYSRLMGTFSGIPGLHFDPKLLLHGEQYMEIYKPLPTSACIRCTKRVSGLHDKGKAAIIELELEYQDAKTGEIFGLQRMVAFLRGAGGFSPDPKKPFAYVSRKASEHVPISFSDKRHRAFESAAPDVEYAERISPNQALIYRLSGDMNPLHSDPSFASDAGFPRPILHGLCTLGFAVRAVIRCCCDGDPTRIVSINSRFLHHVYPGETLVTVMHKADHNSKIFFRCKVREREIAVLSGVIGLKSTHSRI